MYRCVAYEPYIRARIVDRHIMLLRMFSVCCVALPCRCVVVVIVVVVGVVVVVAFGDVGDVCVDCCVIVSL